MSQPKYTQVQPKTEARIGFEVETVRTGKLRKVAVNIFDDHATMEAYVSELYEGQPHGDAGFAYTLYYLKEQLAAFDHLPAAMIVLCKPHIHLTSVSHEIAHAALHLYELDHNVAKIMGYKEQEVFAYTISDLTEQIFGELFSAGILEPANL